MSDQKFPERWPIVGSTHADFPSTSVVHLVPKQSGSERFEFKLDDSEAFFEADFPSLTAPPGAAGTFKGQIGNKHRLEVKVFPGKPRHLCGLLFNPDREGPPTGVWVAEEQQPPTDPPDKST